VEAARDRAEELIDLHFSRIKGRLIHSPDALAGAAFYLACAENNVPATQVLIVSMAGRSIVWLRQNTKRLRMELKLRDPKDEAYWKMVRDELKLAEWEEPL